MNSEFPTTSRHLIGTVLLGRFRIVRELAKGGMGVVYLARSEGAGGFIKPYVVKLVLPEHADNRRFVEMFAREARILANLRHPGIVSVIEFDRQDDAYVMVLEYVRGYHLGQWAKYVRLKRRTIPIEILLQLMIEVLEALHYAHSMVHPDGTPMHIVHRDISPSNILLDEDGRARLLDFGVARMHGGNQEYHTQVKGFVGKLMYSAPELFAEAEATAQSDCYACAVVLHEILIGRNVFRGESQASTLNRVLHHKPDLVEPLRPEVPRGLDAVLQKALAKEPGDRYADAREFATALRTFQREPESEVRARFAALLKDDFAQDMAEMLGLESLADRDEAWRRLSHQGNESFEIDPDTFTMEDVEEERGGPTLRTRPRASSLHASARPVPIEMTPVRLSRSGHPRNSNSSVRSATDSGSLAGSLVPPPPPALPSGVGVGVGRTSVAGSVPTGTQPATAQSHAVPPFVVGLLLAAGVAAGVVLALRRAPAEPLPPPQIRVVTEQGLEPLTNASTEELPRDEPRAVDTVPQSTPKEASPSEGERRSSERRSSRSGPDPMSLTRAFRKQQGKVEACFVRHAVAVEGLPMMQLEFDLAASGKLERVRVLPATLASTALGKCLADTAAATNFPSQGRPVSFAIPITATTDRMR